MNILQRLQNEMNQIEEMKLQRRLYPSIEGHNFTSNDYLGLSQHPEIIRALQDGLDQYGMGSVGSRLLGGDRHCFHELEQKWSEWKGYEASLFFNSGFNANLSIPSALGTRNTHIFSDKLNHASLYDGIALSDTQLHRYAHNDLDHLESLLAKYTGERIIITESVFSMDGDQAPLVEIQKLAEKHHCLFIVDEAHSDGVFGEEGKGLVHQLALESKIDLVISTFGKAYACAGAIVSGKKILIDTLMQKSRGFTYTTAIPPAITVAISKAIDVSIAEDNRRADSHRNSKRFREILTQEGFDLANSSSQIVPIVLGENDRALKWANHLQNHGFWIQAIRHPTVPKGKARLRINICAHHHSSILNELAQQLIDMKNSGL